MWFILFSPWTKSLINFWLGMTCAVGILITISLTLNRENIGTLFKYKSIYIIIGIISAIILYAIFLLGNLVLDSLFGFASEQVSDVYGVRLQAPRWMIGFLLLLIIGPGEEIFWRGFIQHRLSDKVGPTFGIILASTIYALVHLWSFNIMLLLAAGVCGVFWGVMFWRYKSIVPVIISHSLWDVLIFIIFPLK